ncbi:MAG TPA: DUF488 family protein [Povalibacter sp.]|uniref:DUF488 domain-containing protein n=1 Tax=Povalibacter sp. TaxID=1962978 RepID=UPI002B56E02B|nr:DUF488 family protein [Povalibacter sp.]HMN46581.1 DUF488 family protein [Povalibacter sp.]
MAVHIVRLGTPRGAKEGIRIGTVRRPPRGVPKSEFASRNFYDVWLPNLAPTDELVKLALSGDAHDWKVFVRRYRAEMKAPQAVHLLDTLAALSHRTDFSVGCYCENEAHCHRSILRELFKEHGAKVAR